MSSLREIKSRIASVKNTLKITSAMKMVASAKLHKAQTAIAGYLPYEQKLHHILADLLRDDDLIKAMEEIMGMDPNGADPILQDVESDYIPEKQTAGRVAIVAFSSNGSLCGAFNANITRQMTTLVDRLYENGYSTEDIDVYTVGRKVNETATKMRLNVVSDLSSIADKPSYDAAAGLARTLVDSFASGEVSQIILLYSHYASPVSQPVVRENYLPLALKDFSNDFDATPDGTLDYILEPDPISIVKSLLPQVLLLKIYTVLLDSNAAEHAARTMAMQIASDNAQDLIGELTLAYNKGRQQEITAEILDLASGSMV